MPDLREGESIEVKGSASKPYVLKNVGGVLSCTCPSWRNQSLGIERRTCKHLRALRGDAAEELRTGGALPVRAKEAKTTQAPPLLLAETWDGAQDVQGWWLSEKLDGVRAYWDGKQFLSRLGNRYYAPAWFTAGLPAEPLDGELWLARKAFQQTMSVVRRHDESDHWDQIRYLVFDAPVVDGDFEKRFRSLKRLMERQHPTYAAVHPQTTCQSIDHLQEELTKIEAIGGEGLMLRQPGSDYAVGRSNTLLKVKRFLDAEARVIGHEPGRGKHKGRLGALVAELIDGTQFNIGTGLSDADREQPPGIGSVVNFRYQELSDSGVPRFPVYAGVRERTMIAPQTEEEPPMATATKRSFEFQNANSDKFWEIAVSGKEVTVRFGRTGTNGQTQTKAFPDEAAATKHAEKLVKQKTGKGYSEITPL